MLAARAAAQITLFDNTNSGLRGRSNSGAVVDASQSAGYSFRLDIGSNLLKIDSVSLFISGGVDLTAPTMELTVSVYRTWDSGFVNSMIPVLASTTRNISFPALGPPTTYTTLDDLDLVIDARVAQTFAVVFSSPTASWSWWHGDPDSAPSSTTTGSTYLAYTWFRSNWQTQAQFFGLGRAVGEVIAPSPSPTPTPTPTPSATPSSPPSPSATPSTAPLCEPERCIDCNAVTGRCDECYPSLFLNGDGRCVERAAPGQPCSADDACVSGVCGDGACCTWDPVSIGCSRCAAGSGACLACANQALTPPECSSPSSLTGQCTDSTQCLFDCLGGQCCRQATATDSGCDACGPNGACISCAEGSLVNDQCVSSSGPGAPQCFDNLECVSNLCTAFVCCSLEVAASGTCARCRWDGSCGLAGIPGSVTPGGDGGVDDDYFWNGGGDSAPKKKEESSNAGVIGGSVAAAVVGIGLIGLAWWKFGRGSSSPPKPSIPADASGAAPPSARGEASPAGLELETIKLNPMAARQTSSATSV